MQTFLPYPNFRDSAKCLDRKRLGKQRVEATQILRTLRGDTNGWRNHPAVLMWRGYESALEQYTTTMIDEWVERGYKNTLQRYNHTWIPEYPPWLGDRLFHDSHKSNLLRKDPIWYEQFEWNVSPDLPYIWPMRKD